jgi:hypothetical protein
MSLANSSKYWTKASTYLTQTVTLSAFDTEDSLEMLLTRGEALAKSLTPSSLEERFILSEVAGTGDGDAVTAIITVRY